MTDLSAIRAVWERATPDWQQQHDMDDYGLSQIIGNVDANYEGDGMVYTSICEVNTEAKDWRANAAFIAASWAYVRDLLALADRQQAEIAAVTAERDRLREALQFYRDGFQYHWRRSETGIDLSQWRPKQELLDDCGNRAIEALSAAGKVQP